jgi:tRNA G18 (ribose-2'-O)-methylase SpoU
MRGYFGIGIYEGKSTENIGGLWRSAHAFGAAAIFTIGFRPPRQPTDTSCAARHVPLFQHKDFETFRAQMPFHCSLVAIENAKNGVAPSWQLPAFSHPERAFYLLGAEDRGLPANVLAECDAIVEIPSSLCLNVATAASIVLYDRIAKNA